MKKILGSFLLVLAFSSLAMAQISEDQLRLQFDQMEQQMAEALLRMQQSMGDGSFFLMDTMIVHQLPFGNGTDEPGLKPSGEDLLQLQQLFGQLLEEITPDNLEDFDQLMEELQRGIPAPDQLEAPSTEPNPNSETPMKSNRQRKIYSL